MEIKNIILPKTDPDKVFEYANDFVKKLSKTEDYKIAKIYQKRKNKIVDIKEIVERVCAVILMFSFFIIFFIIMASEFITKPNKIAIISIATIIILISILIIAAFNYIVKKLSKKIENYFKLVQDKSYEHRLYAKDMLNENRTKYDCIHSWYLEDIDKIRNWAKKKDVNFIINKEEDRPYKEISIYMCKNGITIDKLRLHLYDYDEEMKSILSQPGSIDFTFLDEEFWESKASFDKYLEFSERR